MDDCDVVQMVGHCVIRRLLKKFFRDPTACENQMIQQCTTGNASKRRNWYRIRQMIHSCPDELERLVGGVRNNG